MAVTLLVVALVGLGVLLGTALLSWRIHARFDRTPGAFRCQLRLPGQRRRSRSGVRRDWGRRATSAIWVHDVLLIRCGRFGQHVIALPVRIPEDEPHPAPGPVRGLGADPHQLSLRLDDGLLVDLALPAEAQVPAVGPFLAASIPGLPAAPAERRPRRW